MSEFEREVRYVVLKIKDALAHLSACQLDRLQEIGEAIAAGRAADGKPPFNAVVVEQDWPEFDLVWQMIEARMKGQSYHLILPPLADRFSALEAERDEYAAEARRQLGHVYTIMTERNDLAESVAYWKADSAAAWDKCEERRKENEALAAKLMLLRATFVTNMLRHLPEKTKHEIAAEIDSVVNADAAEAILRERDVKVLEEAHKEFAKLGEVRASARLRQMAEDRRAGK